jgi:hypothetical protein
MNKIDYYDKYLKYKEKYILLKNQMSIEQQQGGYKKYSHYDYYICHATMKLNNLLGIIADGKIKKGTELPEENRVLGGYQGCDEIFATISFEGLKSNTHLLDLSIILHPKILKDYNVNVYTGWGNELLLTLLKIDTDETRAIKISKIKTFLENPSSLPEILQGIGVPSFLQHELRFSKVIPIKKYIIGISCPNPDDETYKKIRNALDKKGLKKVKIFRTNIPPTNKEF